MHYHIFGTTFNYYYHIFGTTFCVVHHIFGMTFQKKAMIRVIYNSCNERIIYSLYNGRIILLGGVAALGDV